MQDLHKRLLLCLLACLRPNAHGNLIIGGTTVPDDQMKYMVSLWDKAVKQHLCGGFLVSKDFVITSASCDKKNLEYVYIGIHNLEDKRVPQRFKTKCISSDSGIMLLKLDKSLYKPETIPIPKSEMHLEANQMCHVAGWGSESCTGGFVNHLKMVDVPFDPQVCKDNGIVYPANAICAGDNKKGYTELDNGGPLVCNGLAVGVAFFSNTKCDNDTLPYVYANIAKDLQWIENKMSNPTGVDCMPL